MSQANQDPSLRKLNQYYRHVRSIGFRRKVTDGTSTQFFFYAEHLGREVRLVFNRATSMKERPFIYEKFAFWVDGRRLLKEVRTPSINIRSRIIRLLRKHAPEILLK